MPGISILLPVRDAAPTLACALESCLIQTWRDLEIIAVDDHSSDDTPKILERFARRDSRVRIFDAPEPGGIVIALQTAVANASADLIARMDADDISHPERLSAQVTLLNEDRDLAAVGCQVRIVKHGDDLGQGYRRYERWLNACTSPDQIARERFIESPIAHPSVMFRREALDAAGGYRDVPWAEDYDLWLRMLRMGMRIGKVPRVLLDWSDGPSRLSRSDERYSQDSFQRCKAHHLALHPAIQERGVVIWAAGRIGKRMARLLRAEGVIVHRFVEIHPRRIGNRIGGTPVVAVDDERAEDGAVHISAAGQPGRRTEVRRAVQGLGLVEGESFLCVA